MMKVAIIDYGAGNLRSAAKAFERIAREEGMDIAVDITGKADQVAAADRLVLPGDGAFADCMHGLAAIDGMSEALEEAVIHRARPFLGVCVGMQLMAERGLEFGECSGLGWIGGQVEALPVIEGGPQLPHMGWNDFDHIADHPVLTGIRPGDHAYFVHSYHFRATDPAHVLADVEFSSPVSAVSGGAVTAIIGRDNIIGTQFHPEKSQATGLRLLKNFLHWNP